MLFIVLGALIGGIIILVLALFPSIKLVRLLPKGVLQRQWTFLFGLIIFFIIGYFCYAIVIWKSEYSITNLIVSGIFFGGSIFVLTVCLLTLTTIKDIQRICILEQENIKDPLMGIFNRRYLERRLNEEINRAKRYKHSLSLLMLDVDYFKNINDTYGHQVGDIVLKKLAQIIVGLARETDFVARYGGEEIIIVLPDTTISSAVIMAERCRNQVFEELIIGSNETCGESIDSITVSIGVSTVNDKNCNMDQLIEHADIALYRAKESGRDQVVVYDSTLSKLRA